MRRNKQTDAYGGIKKTKNCLNSVRYFELHCLLLNSQIVAHCKRTTDCMDKSELELGPFTQKSKVLPPSNIQNYEVKGKIIKVLNNLNNVRTLYFFQVFYY